MTGRLLLVVCVAVLFSGGTLSAGLLYLQPWDGGANAYASQDDINGYGNFATMYDNFTLGSTNAINEVSWVGTYWNPAVQGPILQFTLTFWNDNAGQPGAPLSTYVIPGTGGETLLTGATYEYDALLPGSPFVAAGGTQYWLSIVPQLGFPPQWGWNSGTGGDGSSWQDFFGSRSLIGADMAFDLEGGPTGVPEPVSMTLAGAGLILLGFVARRRRA